MKLIPISDPDNPNERSLDPMGMEVFSALPKKWPEQQRFEMSLDFQKSLRQSELNLKPKYDLLLQAETDPLKRDRLLQDLRREARASVFDPRTGIPDSEYEGE